MQCIIMHHQWLVYVHHPMNTHQRLSRCRVCYLMRSNLRTQQGTWQQITTSSYVITLYQRQDKHSCDNPPHSSPYIPTQHAHMLLFLYMHTYMAECDKLQPRELTGYTYTKKQPQMTNTSLASLVGGCLVGNYSSQLYSHKQFWHTPIW